MGIQQLPLPVHSQWWNSPKIPMLDKELAWEFYKTQTKELNIFSCDSQANKATILKRFKDAKKT